MVRFPPYMFKGSWVDYPTPAHTATLLMFVVCSFYMYLVKMIDYEIDGFIYILLVSYMYIYIHTHTNMYIHMDTHIKVIHI